MIWLNWWAIILPLAVVSAVAQEIMFPASSILWQLPIGFVTGVLVMRWLSA